MNCLISVIVPVYRVEKQLDKCVESIVNQTYKNLEIILVDDGSPDNCPQMCDLWAEKDCRVKVIHKKNGGVSSARNAGLDIVKGEYVAFCDSDDYFEQNCIELLYSSIKNNDCDLCVCNVNYVNSDYSLSHITKYSGFIDNTRNEALAHYVNGNYISPACPGKLYCRGNINDLRFYESKRIGEDYLFNYYYIKNIDKVIHINASLYNYVQLDNSVTHKISSELLMRWKNTKIILEDINETDIYNVCLKKYSNELLCCIREIISCNDKNIIKKCYDETVTEIKRYSNAFFNLNIPLKRKLAIYWVCHNSKSFKALYKFYSK